MHVRQTENENKKLKTYTKIIKEYRDIENKNLRVYRYRYINYSQKIFRLVWLCSYTDVVNVKKCTKVNLTVL